MGEVLPFDEHDVSVALIVGEFLGGALLAFSTG